MTPVAASCSLTGSVTRASSASFLVNVGGQQQQRWVGAAGGQGGRGQGGRGAGGQRRSRAIFLANIAGQQQQGSVQNWRHISCVGFLALNKRKIISRIFTRTRPLLHPISSRTGVYCSAYTLPGDHLLGNKPAETQAMTPQLG